MGRETPDKHVYDTYAAEFFSAQGFCAIVLSNRYSDVAGWHPQRREFAIVEVKSPSETTVDISYCYATPDWKGMTRGETWTWLKQRGFKTESENIAKLLTFTITSQLFRYWNLRKIHVERFRKSGVNIPDPKIISTHLVLPVSYKPILRKLLLYLSQLAIRSSPIRTKRKICVAKIDYSKK